MHEEGSNHRLAAWNTEGRLHAASAAATVESGAGYNGAVYAAAGMVTPRKRAAAHRRPDAQRNSEAPAVCSERFGQSAHRHPLRPSASTHAQSIPGPHTEVVSKSLSALRLVEMN